MTEPTCAIWGTVALQNIALPPFKGENDPVLAYDSPRAGGVYCLPTPAGMPSLFHEDNGIKRRLTTWLIEQRNLGDKCPLVTNKIVDRVKQRPLLTVTERADRLLLFLARHTPTVGHALEYFTQPPGRFDMDESQNSYALFLNMLAWSECTSLDDSEELDYLLGYLGHRGWVKIDRTKTDGTATLTVDGYAHLAELEKTVVDSSQGFVAMWFDDDVKPVYNQSIEPAIRDAGYKPLRIDRKEHVNMIDDEIVAEIRRSRFMVADFTHGEKGIRGGVYYEAGFGHGLNIPVIFTCRKNVFDDKDSGIHFDLNHYNFIRWEKEGDTFVDADRKDDSGKPLSFRKTLATRIQALIGLGPEKKPN